MDAQPQDRCARIMEIVSEVTGVSKADILSPSREAPVVYARHLGMYYTRWATRMTLKEVAEAWGRKDHTTVRHAIQKMAACPPDPYHVSRLMPIVASAYLVATEEERAVLAVVPVQTWES